MANLLLCQPYFFLITLCVHHIRENILQWFLMNIMYLHCTLLELVK